VIKQRNLLAIQAAVALLVIGAAAGVELAAIAATAAGTVSLSRCRGARLAATAMTMFTALVAVLAAGSPGMRSAHNDRTGPRRVVRVQHAEPLADNGRLLP
jgi:hypothetical protein